MQLGYFAADGGVTFRAEGFGKLAKSAGKAERTFIYNHRPPFFREFLKACGASFFKRKKSFEDEAVAWQSGVDERRDERRCPRKAFYLDP